MNKHASTYGKKSFFFLFLKYRLSRITYDQVVPCLLQRCYRSHDLLIYTYTLSYIHIHTSISIYASPRGGLSISPFRSFPVYTKPVSFPRPFVALTHEKCQYARARRLSYIIYTRAFSVPMSIQKLGAGRGSLTQGLSQFAGAK